MLFAAIGDIHGNFPAFEAVMKHIDGTGIQTVVCTGDAVVGYPWPNEVVQHLRTRRIYAVQGAMDREAARYVRRGSAQLSDEELAQDAVIAWTHKHCRSDNLEFLKGLPKRRLITLEGLSILLCHGTPSSQSDVLEEETPEQKFQRQREAANTHIIVCGRTHRPFSKWVGDTLFVNPGSVGDLLPEPGIARYAIINTETRPWSVQLPSVRYDVTAVFDRMREVNGRA